MRPAQMFMALAAIALLLTFTQAVFDETNHGPKGWLLDPVTQRSPSYWTYTPFVRSPLSSSCVRICRC
jgi:hypothetical protein